MIKTNFKNQENPKITKIMVQTMAAKLEIKLKVNNQK